MELDEFTVVNRRGNRRRDCKGCYADIARGEGPAKASPRRRKTKSDDPSALVRAEMAAVDESLLRRLAPMLAVMERHETMSDDDLNAASEKVYLEASREVMAALERRRIERREEEKESSSIQRLIEALGPA